VPPPFARRPPDRRIESAAFPGLALVALTEADLPTIRKWLEQPYVARWWSPAEQAVAEIRGHVSSETVAPYLMVERDRPIGYLQAYHANDDPFWEMHDLPRETFGLDLFIGDGDCLGRGLGPRFLRLAIARLFEMPATARVHIDPDPSNGVAIKACERAGFHGQGEIVTHDGRALYMTIDR
jgi:aminoglycoside 6'-N-acetyltransferase